MRCSAYMCVTQYAPKHVISAEAFASPEIELLGDEAAQGVCVPGAHFQGGGFVVTELDQLYSMIDLLQRVDVAVFLGFLQVCFMRL